MKLPALTSFHFFTVAAQTESFVQAARLLHVTHGAVSRQVRLLEEAIGVELFERRNRAIFLNDAGRLLYNVTRPFFEQLEGTVYRLQREAREEVLVVSCEPTIAMKWLILRLPDFQAAHPNLQLQLLAAGGPIDFARSGADVAVRRDDFHWDKSIHSETICEEWIGPVCTPTLRPEGQRLDGLRLLRSKTRPLAWDNWMRLVDVAAPEATWLEYEHFYLCIQAAAAGLGVSMASLLMVQDELESGQLVAPFGFRRDGSRYCLLSPRSFDDGSKCRVFLDWITEQMADSARRVEAQ
ncbi:LysR family transcriptional regulator [Pseudomonas capeferrum]|uniref:LysR substrate-binding domain-containing protein n=1 Tax=Pseudomonas capeferrum TaxID=1495066 RepID=UPI0015E35365|nr:LysR substrate-binding domain-containing protein [Pseudomonas capeferrum]MBA1204456.1 LysR family transcriptional regulator [Pseudomonas capeferrum]